MDIFKIKLEELGEELEVIYHEEIGLTIKHNNQSIFCSTPETPREEIYKLYSSLKANDFRLLANIYMVNLLTGNIKSEANKTDYPFYSKEDE